ncbi:prepilin peptidase [Microbacterium terricola]|uniref:Prepilin leader peptidase/N-methyltransferase n=1 Tax=Microbacterium terricola TaxID=344163 RepID=A0ABM8DXM7_9MICO|nr:A24 family peptidase [Microbacterium terricola]UYK38945.1 prepilin peptidase [Microbacterium terricola]BDV30355.1 prepilin peptidase [Microbacterium terricola]
MTLFVLLCAGVFGLIIGSFLNVVVYRVPAGISLNRPSQCPGCDAPVRPWQNVPVLSWLALRGKCASCGAPISARYPLVELATGVAFVAVASAWLDAFRLASLAQRPDASEWIVLVAYLYFAAISIALTLIDLDTRRLPNAIVLPSYLVALVLFTVACVLGAEWESLARAAIGGAALYGFYFLLRLVRPDGMGGGDVKLAGVVGLYLGWLGWGALIVGAFAAFLLGGIYGVALLARRRAGRKTAIPFGPWMLAGAWVGIFAGEPIARWYIGLLAV